jgi:hypothetical protein
MDKVYYLVGSSSMMRIYFFFIRWSSMMVITGTEEGMGVVVWIRRGSGVGQRWKGKQRSGLNDNGVNIDLDGK